MQFITSGNRIAVENFTVGYLYTITFTGGEYIHCACTGIGMDFVMFSRTAPEYTYALTMETAEGVSSIDLYSEGGGTTNYNDLTNKPQINGVELTGNKTSSDLGIQPLITADNKLSYTLVSGLGTAATTASSDYATAAQGSLADSAVQPADMNSALNGKQNLINSDNMLSADLVDDTSTTNKFATAAELQQIETNKTNILSSLDANGKKNYVKTNTVTFTGYSLDIPCDALTGDAVLYIKNITTNDTDASTNLVIFYDANNTSIAQRLCNRGEVVVYDNVELVRTLDHIRIYSSDNYAHSAGDTATFTDIMVCPKSLWDISHKYEPYALSNVDLTSNILSIQTDLAKAVMRGDTYVANTTKTYTLTAAKTYLISVVCYNVAGLFLAFKYSTETTPRLFPVYKTADFDNYVTVSAEANSSNIQISSASSSTWYYSNIAML